MSDALDRYRAAGFMIDETRLDGDRPGYRASVRLVSPAGHSFVHEVAVGTSKAEIARRIKWWIKDHPQHGSATVTRLRGIG